MSEKIPGERRGVLLVYHAEGRRRPAARYIRRHTNTDDQPVLVGAATSTSPAESPYTVERLVDAVRIDDRVHPIVQLRIASYWHERGVPTDVVTITGPP